VFKNFFPAVAKGARLGHLGGGVVCCDARKQCRFAVGADPQLTAQVPDVAASVSSAGVTGAPAQLGSPREDDAVEGV